jgi:hypothetical protein
MSLRTDLLANVTTALSGSSVSVSSELPWSSGGTELYRKNKKKFYLSETDQDITQLQSTLDTNDVFQTENSLQGFITVDAKNQPADIQTVVSAVLNSRLSVSDYFVRECEASSETEGDEITYTFEYRFVNLI